MFWGRTLGEEWQNLQQSSIAVTFNFPRAPPPGTETPLQFLHTMLNSLLDLLIQARSAEIEETFVDKWMEFLANSLNCC